MELRDLYQEVILDHSKHPRNFREVAHATHVAEGYNPLCGDRLTLYVTRDGERITDLAFKGSGCAISTASVSMLTEVLKGKTIAEAKNLFALFHDLVATEKLSEEQQSALGKLAVFQGVKEFPARVKCATLCWHTLKSALEEINHE